MPNRTAFVSLAILAAATLAGCAAPAVRPAEQSAAPVPTLYERVASMLANRPDLASLGEPPAQMAEVAWMAGEWTIDSTVFATPTTPERTSQGRGTIALVLGGTWLQTADEYPDDGGLDLGFLTYNTVTRRWVSLGLDATGNAVTTTGEGWLGDRLQLIATGAEILGLRVTLRQTLHKVGIDEFTLLNEEQRADSSWVALDEYRYRRAAARP